MSIPSIPASPIPDADANVPDLPQWTVEQIDERRYYIKLVNAPVAAIDDKVWAIQIWQPQPEHQMWIIENRPQMGENVFT